MRTCSVTRRYAASRGFTYLRTIPVHPSAAAAGTSTSSAALSGHADSSDSSDAAVDDVSLAAALDVRAGAAAGPGASVASASAYMRRSATMRPFGVSAAA